jgi:plastocyanin
MLLISIADARRVQEERRQAVTENAQQPGLKRQKLIAVVAATLLFTGIGGSLIVGRGVAATAEHAAVAIDDFTFGPGTITVKRGTTVTWTN